MTVRECKASEFADCDVVFSGLDSDVAGDIGALPFLFALPLCNGYITKANVEC